MQSAAGAVHAYPRLERRRPRTADGRIGLKVLGFWGCGVLVCAGLGLWAPGVAGETTQRTGFRVLRLTAWLVFCVEDAFELES